MAEEEMNVETSVVEGTEMVTPATEEVTTEVEAPAEEVAADSAV